jgi:hypothetical protein
VALLFLRVLKQRCGLVEQVRADKQRVNPERGVKRTAEACFNLGFNPPGNFLQGTNRRCFARFKPAALCGLWNDDFNKDGGEWLRPGPFRR